MISVSSKTNSGKYSPAILNVSSLEVSLLIISVLNEYLYLNLIIIIGMVILHDCYTIHICLHHNGPFHVTNTYKENSFSCKRILYFYHMIFTIDTLFVVDMKLNIYHAHYLCMLQMDCCPHKQCTWRSNQYLHDIVRFVQLELKISTNSNVILQKLCIAETHTAASKIE